MFQSANKEEVMEKGNDQMLVADDHSNGQNQIWHSIFGFVDIMILRCAIQLGIAEAVHSEVEEGAPSPRPISVESIASRLPHPPSDPSALRRVMRFLAHKKIFSASTDPNTGETLYGPTAASAGLLRGSSGRRGVAPMILFLCFQLDQSHWSNLSESVARGGATAHRLKHGTDLWEYNEITPDGNTLFNDAMSCFADSTLDAVLDVYKDKFAELQTLVDVGGGSGMALAKITSLCPHLRGINFDLPHVVADAPEHPNVVHVAGSVFEDAIPQGDAIFMEGLLHCFKDDQCLKILKNCRAAIPEKTGKLIIVENVLDTKEEGPTRDMQMAIDMITLSMINGGERTEEEWKKLLRQGGFPRYNIINLPAMVSIIEAYPL